MKSQISNQSFTRQSRKYTYKHSYNRSLEELNLMDSFLFEASTEDSEDAKKIAKVIIERVTGIPVKNLTVLLGNLQEKCVNGNQKQDKKGVSCWIG